MIHNHTHCAERVGFFYLVSLRTLYGLHCFLPGNMVMMMHGHVSNPGLVEGLVRFWQCWLSCLHLYLLMVLSYSKHFSAYQNQWHLQ